MRFLTFLLAGYLLLLGCLPPNADAHELTESLALRNHHERYHHDSELLDFLLDHYAGQRHSHGADGGDREHQSLPFHHAHDCPHVLVVAWVTPVLVPGAPRAFPAAVTQLPGLAAGAPVGIANPCWQPPRA